MPDNVTIQWTAEPRTVPQTTPPLDAWKVSVGLPSPGTGIGTEVAAVYLTDLALRSATLEVPVGTGYVAAVTLASADGTALGPTATSGPFNVGALLPAPLTVTVQTGGLGTTQP